MAEEPSVDLGEPPSVTALSMAETATTHATEQQIDPWSVSAATDEQGDALAFDYEARYPSTFSSLWSLVTPPTTPSSSRLMPQSYTPTIFT